MKTRNEIKAEIIEALSKNELACWIFWEARNLQRTYDVDTAYEMMLDLGSTAKSPDNKHSLQDTIENLEATVISMLSLKDTPAESAEFDIYDIIDTEIVCKLNPDFDYGAENNETPRFLIS